jgi:HAD superfamily hydrolase (TIGR01509 family)
MPKKISTLFCDIGGVLLTNGWDTESRKKVFAEFNLDYEEVAQRHKTAGDIDAEEISFDQYLDYVVFFEPRNFSKEQFINAVKAESKKLGNTIEIINSLRTGGFKRIFSLNNETRDLHDYRKKIFQLDEIFDGYFTSAYLSASKPKQRIYNIAMNVMNALSDEILFIDDRLENIQTAKNLGWNTIHFQGEEQLRVELKEYILE